MTAISPISTIVPEDLDWTDNPDGTRTSTWFGDRQANGEQFGYAFFIPAGLWDPLHSHAQDATITVVSGMLVLEEETGARRKYPPGSVLHVPANTKHADGADVDTVIIGTTSAPFDTTYA